MASNASTPQVNQVSVTGGGSSQANATDSTTITAAGSRAGVYYYLQDQIGSTRVITDSAGNVCYDADFYPYGGELPVVDNCRADFKFAGKERDPESNLDNSQARFYSNQWGRFINPDPLGNAVADPRNPQSWNMHSYVLNNSLGLVDPSGLDTCQGWSDVNGSTDESPQDKDSCAAAGGTWIPTLDQTITVNGGPDNSSSSSDSNYSVGLTWYAQDTLVPPQT